SNSAEIVKADKNVPASLKELGLRVSKFLGLDEEQSVQLLQCYLQEDYRGTRDSLKTVLQDDRQSQTLLLKIADYYYEERFCILRCVLHILTYFQDERHPYMVPYSQCMEKLDKELVPNYRKQFEELYKAEAPTWETHGSLMTERQVSRWFVQCLREQSMLLEIIFLYYAYFEMTPEELLTFAKMFKDQGFSSRQTNRHLVDESMDPLVDRIGYFSALILVEGMEIDSLHERLLDDRKEEHNTDGSSGVIRRMGSTAIQMNVFQYLTKLLRAISSEGNDIIDTACEVLAASSIPPLFWKTEPTAGLGIILDSVCGMFPHLLSPLLQLLTALVSDKSTAKKNWRSLGAGQTNLRIPQGTTGQVMLDDRAYLVRWEYSYSSWTLFTCEIEMLLHVVSTADVLQHCQRVKPIIDLVHKVISTDVSIADCLLPITSRIYMLLHRLTTVISPPVDIIASCVKCLTVLASRMPAKGMNAGGYGNLLMGIEQPQGEYGVTVSFLNLVMTLVRGQLGSTQSQGLVPCIVFVLKEMLPNYHKWRYNSHGVREKIGYLILQLIHAILNLCPEMDPRSSSAPSLQSLCIFSLANTEAGQAVISIMGIGVDTIDMVMASQSCSDGESQGQLLIQTVKLAFSVTNNVIRLKPPSSVVSPLEHALTQHGAHRNNLIAVLAKYIYHKHDPALPRLAIQLLKRLATVAPMSVYACLGSDASAIRDAFLTRLQSRIEDMRIKVMILDFLTVAVETQPGLIELFLNLEVKDGSEGCKEFSLGEWSCLHVVLELIDSKQQERYWCPPLLQRATIAFLHALWQDRRDSAMLVLRNKPKFWGNLTNPLFGTLPAPSETSELSVLETCALIMKIICLEIYSVVKGSLDQSLKDTLKKFSAEKRFAYWSGYVKSLAFHVAETEGSGCASVTEYQMLISAWRMLLVVSTSHADIVNLTDAEVQQLFLDVLSGTKALLLVPTSGCCLQLGSMLCTLLLILLRQWKSKLGSADEIIDSLTQILDGVLQADQQMMGKTKAKIFSALITVCVLGLHLAKELCEVDEEGDSWLQVTRSLPLLPTLCTTLEGAAAVATAGILHSICLPLLSVYQLSSNGGGQVPVSSRRSLDGPAWPGVYRLSVSLMERLLKTLRYNFLTDALDFVGVHQERILQCLNAVRTVQSLACLEEADHTAKNGESIPSAVLPRLQRAPQISAKPASPESEVAEQKALRTVQYSLLKILSKCLAALRHFTPDICQILLDQSLDLAEYNILFMLSFTTPAFDSEVAPSFGTLLATINVALNMLGELDKKKDPFSLAAGPSPQQEGNKTLNLSRYFRRGGPSSPAGAVVLPRLPGPFSLLPRENTPPSWGRKARSPSSSWCKLLSDTCKDKTPPTGAQGDSHLSFVSHRFQDLHPPGRHWLLSSSEGPLSAGKATITTTSPPRNCVTS
ncbi:Nucleoporin-like protein, partial [Ophiophagus hannah]